MANRTHHHAEAISAANRALKAFGRLFADVTAGNMGGALRAQNSASAFAGISAEHMQRARESSGKWCQMCVHPVTGQWVRLDQMPACEPKEVA